MTKIIIFKEKHGDRYFDASTPEAELKSMYSILKERNASGHYYHNPGTEEDALKYIRYTDEEKVFLELDDAVLATLSESVQERAKRVKRRQANALASHKRELDEWNQIQQIVNLPFEEAAQLTYKNAYGRELNLIQSIMQSRGDAEYEGFDYEELETPKV